MFVPTAHLRSIKAANPLAASKAMPKPKATPATPKAAPKAKKRKPKAKAANKAKAKAAGKRRRLSEDGEPAD